MDELIVSGKKYISSKRAHELTGYAKDYIGQLARGGKVAATRVGRAWYVEEASLLAHLGSENAQEAPEKALVAPQAKPFSPVLSPSLYQPYTFPKTWSQIKYMHDDRELLPTIVKTAPKETDEITNKNIDISDSIDKAPVILMHNKIPDSSTIQARRVTSTSLVFDIPKPVPRISGTVQPRPIRTVAKRSVDFLPVLAVAAVVVVAFAGLGLFVPIQGVSGGSATASVFSSIGEYWDALIQSELFQMGATAFANFARLLITSFWDFFERGLDFLKTL